MLSMSSNSASMCPYVLRGKKIYSNRSEKYFETNPTNLDAQKFKFVFWKTNFERRNPDNFTFEHFRIDQEWCRIGLKTFLERLMWKGENSGQHKTFSWKKSKNSHNSNIAASVHIPKSIRFSLFDKLYHLNQIRMFFFQFIIKRRKETHSWAHLTVFHCSISHLIQIWNSELKKLTYFQ